MNNLNLILPEIFISCAIMFLLIVGVFKKNSSQLIYNLSIARRKVITKVKVKKIALKLI